MKPYKAALDELIRKTEARLGDLDPRFFSLLEQLQQKGRAVEGVRSVTQSLDGVERDRILNWRAYVYTLLRKFDEAAYQALKGSEDGNKSPTNRKSTDGAQNGSSDLNVTAPEFTPGVYWGGSLTGATPWPENSPVAYSFGAPLPPMAFGDFSSPPPRVGVNGRLDTGSGVKLPKNPSSPQAGSPSLSKLLNLDDGEADSTPPLAPAPLLPTGPMPSPGSAGHGEGKCKPCAFLYTKGCANGAECPFCHLCDAEAKKRRKRDRYRRSAEAN